MALCQASNGRVARHLANRIQILAEQQSLRSQASRRQRRLNAGVAGAYHYDIVMFRKEKLFHVDQSSLEKLVNGPGKISLKDQFV